MKQTIFFQVHYLGFNQNNVFGSFVTKVSEQELTEFIKRVVLTQKGKIIEIGVESYE